MLVFVAVVEIKTPDKHVEAAIPDILGRGFNSLRLHWFQSGQNPQVTLRALLADFLLSQKESALYCLCVESARAGPRAADQWREDILRGVLRCIRAIFASSP
jgi:hypothetical protein